MRDLSSFLFIPTALLLSACTAIVAGELSQDDGYPVRNNLDVDTASVCSLVNNQVDGGPTACAQCISTSCKDDVAYACNGADQGNNEVKPWFSKIQTCAENPYDGEFDDNVQWGCSDYALSTPGSYDPNPGTDDSAKEQDSRICIHQNCILPAASPCHQCTITIDKPGNTGETASLGDGACGACLRAACPAVLIECCNALPGGFNACAYPTGTGGSDGPNRDLCLGAADAGNVKADAGVGTLDQCAYEVATQCFTTQCTDICKNPSGT